MSADDSFDRFLSSLGFGRWQIPALLTTVLILVAAPVHLMGSSFLSAPMPFRCFAGHEEQRNDTPTGLGETGLNTSHFDDVCLPLAFRPQESGPGRLADAGPGLRRTGLASCPFVRYDTAVFASTLVSDFDLICERSWLRPVYMTVYVAGEMFGSLAGGYVGDRWGRRRTVLLASTVNLLLVLVVVSAHNYPLMLCMRLLAGFSVTSMLIPIWSLFMECCSCELRDLMGMLLGLPFSVGVVAFAGVAFFIRSWHCVFMAGASPVLLIIPFALLMDESPRWLLQKGRAEEAKAVLTKAVKLNNTKLILPLTESIDKMIQASVSDHPAPGSTGEKPSPAGSMFRGAKKYLADPAMRRILLATAGIWFIHDTLYLGVALSAHNFSSDDPFLYVALTGVMDAMAILVVTPLSTRLGRKVLVWLGFAVGGSFFLVELLIPEDLQWARWIFIMGGFFLIAGTQQINYIYAPELFPTETRARGFAFVQLAGNIGTMCVPLITDVVSHYAWWASSVVFGCMGLTGSLLVFFLPETKDRPLPETLKDVNSRWTGNIRRASRGSTNLAFVIDDFGQIKVS